MQEYTLKIITVYGDKITFKTDNYNNLFAFYNLVESDIKTFNVIKKEKKENV